MNPEISSNIPSNTNKIPVSTPSKKSNRASTEALRESTEPPSQVKCDDDKKRVLESKGGVRSVFKSLKRDLKTIGFIMAPGSLGLTRAYKNYKQKADALYNSANYRTYKEAKKNLTDKANDKQVDLGDVKSAKLQIKAEQSNVKAAKLEVRLWAASICLLAPITVILFGWLIPLWGLLALANAVSAGITGKNIAGKRVDTDPRFKVNMSIIESNQAPSTENAGKVPNPQTKLNQ